MKFPRYCKNLRFSGDGIYSYGAKIANIDLKEKTIQRMGFWSPTNSKHYNYAGKVLQERYGFVCNDIPLTHVQHLSYDDHA